MLNKRLFILFSFIFIGASGQYEYYAVDRADGGVTIYSHAQGSRKSFNDILREAGLEGRPYRQINPDAEVPRSRVDRNFWKASGNKVVVDTQKKADTESDLAAKELRKQQLLKMTKAEYEEAKSLGIIK